MNTNNKAKQLLIIAIILIVGILFLSNNEKSTEIAQNDVFSIYSNATEEDTTIALFTREGCSYCEMFQPIIDALAEDFDFEYIDMDTDDLTDTELSSALSKGNLDINDFGTPTMVIFNNGEVYNHVGYMDRATTFAFLQSAGVIASDLSLPSEFLNLEEIDYNNYVEKIASSETQIIVLTQTTCSHCVTAKPYYDEISSENDISISYFEVDKIDNQEDYEGLQTSLDYLQENEWGTPLMMIVRDGKVISADSGFQSKAMTEAFLKENGII
jgi:thiol-disulfide isomerase/thioredoxin